MILHEQEVDHQTDDLARRKMLPGRLVRLLREAPDQLLEDRTHDMVGHHLGVQVYLGEAADHLVQQVGLVEFLNLLGKFKTLDKNLAGVIEKPLI